MPVILDRLSDDHQHAVLSVWQRAQDARREALGAPALDESASSLQRPGAFGVGMFEGDRLASVAVAIPALADDARSERNVPGLVHISSVATDPECWGRGYAGQCVRGVMSLAVRQGYARCQLWTHPSSAAALRLYEREGFTLSGRQRIDDFGDEIVHLIRELPTPEVISRPAARIVALDPEHRILLMHWRDPVDGYRVWEPPGGGIEPNEPVRDAALREWHEETGLAAPEPLTGPEAVGRDEMWSGRRVVVDEQFLLGRCEAALPPKAAAFTPEETLGYLGHAWVDWRHLDTLDDPVTPDLVAVLRRLDRAGPW